MELNIKTLPNHQGLKLPAYQTASSAGMDLEAAIEEDIIIPCGMFSDVPTGLAIALPYGFEAQLRPRSGLAARFGVTLLNSPGTIDSDFRGEVKIILINHGKEPFTVRRGMRIAQMVISPIMQVSLRECAALDETIRGDGGFGHTGI